MAGTPVKNSEPTPLRRTRARRPGNYPPAVAVTSWVLAVTGTTARGLLPGVIAGDPDQAGLPSQQRRAPLPLTRTLEDGGEGTPCTAGNAAHCRLVRRSVTSSSAGPLPKDEKNATTWGSSADLLSSAFHSPCPDRRAQRDGAGTGRRATVIVAHSLACT